MLERKFLQVATCFAAIFAKNTLNLAFTYICISTFSVSYKHVYKNVIHDWLIHKYTKNPTQNCYIIDLFYCIWAIIELWAKKQGKIMPTTTRYIWTLLKKLISKQGKKTKFVVYKNIFIVYI